MLRRKFGQQWPLAEAPAEVAREAVELGKGGDFKGLKLRLGCQRVADDLATIAAVREAAKGL